VLTQCPNCDTIYRLAAADLGAAHGFVECGECGEQFNALARLADEPKFTTKPGSVVSAATAAADPTAESAAQEPALDTPGGVGSGTFGARPAAAINTPPVDKPEISVSNAAPAGKPAWSDSETPPAVAPTRAVPETPPAAEPVSSVPETAFVAETAPSVPETSPAAEPVLPVPENPPEDEPAFSISEISPAGADETPAAVVTDEGRREFELSPAAAPDDEYAAFELDEPTEPVASAFVGSAAEAGPATDLDELPERPPTSTLSESEHAILFTDPDDGSDPELDEEPDDDLEPIDPDDIPAVIKKEIEALHQPKRKRLRWMWTGFGSVLLLILLAQLGWIFRDGIRAAAPETVALYARACAALGCQPDRPRPNEIELVSRDVRDHPQYRDTLLVNATFVSRSATPAPFPTIQLGLRDATGEIIGVRRFEPIEYLDKSIDIDAGMPPNRPVYIVMEVAQGNNGRPVSFEFTFL